MDIATILGFLSGISLVYIAIALGGNFGIFIDPPSIILVFGGTIAVTLINYPLGDVLQVFNTLKNAFVHRAKEPEELIRKLVEFATIARREGILALESHAGNAGDEFLERSVQLAIDGTTPELLKDILTTEIAFMEERHSMGQAILGAMGNYAPAFGMIGTLIGLVQMLSNMSDPSQIGAGMAVAILTTLYGALLANVVFLPSAGKLKVKTANEMVQKELIIEGILSIQSGDNPRVVEQKLKAFVAPAVRQRIVIGK